MYKSKENQYKFIAVNYVQYFKEIQVYGTRLVLLVRNEEQFPLVLASVDLHDLTQFKLLIDGISLKPEESIVKAVEKYPNLNEFTEPKLVIWAGLEDIKEPAIAYSFIGENVRPTNGNNPEKYFFITNAETGEILYQENKILFIDVTGNVQGNATQDIAADYCEDELPEFMPWSRVNIGGNNAYADEYGDFTILNSGSSPVYVESRLWGLWFRVFNNAGSDAVLNQTVTPPGPVNFSHKSLNTDE